MAPTWPHCVCIIQLSRGNDDVDVGVVIKVGPAWHLCHNGRIYRCQCLGGEGSQCVTQVADLVENVSRVDVRSVRLDVLRTAEMCEVARQRSVHLAGAPQELP